MIGNKQEEVKAMTFEELLNKYNALLEDYEKLESENKELKRRLGITELKEKVIIDNRQDSAFNKFSPNEEKIKLYMSLFRGREDVYAKRWESREGKKGYSPACANEWKTELCNKRAVKCDKCQNRQLLAIDAQVIEKHLRGKDELARDVVGLFPLMEDDMCYILAVDFDKNEWQKDVAVFRDTCREQGLKVAVERSRSGNGAHVWLFFETHIKAATARKLGNLLLTHAMNKRHEIGFESYDRLFPNQDTMPKGGFGNLIALPLQGKARREGNSLFVDDDFIPYSDQWVYLNQIKRLTAEEVDEHIKKLEKIVGVLENNKSIDDVNKEDWQPLKTIALSSDDFPKEVKVIKRNMLYIIKIGISARALNQFKRMAAFNNPDFFKAQAMRMPTYDKPRVIYGFDETEDTLILPRGCEENVLQVLSRQNVKVVLQDQRTSGRDIDVKFSGELREEQVSAVQEMLKYEQGVLAATTAFGKTVIGAYLIAARKVNTLILVHNKQLLEQWKERLNDFLVINEELPESINHKRGKKVTRLIGEIGGGKNKSQGIVDVAIIQSLVRKDEMKELVKTYGMIIVDECHHVSAFSFEQVIKGAMAKYVYGLTATPTRQDGHHPIIYMQCGPIRYKVDAKKQAEERPFEHYLMPRLTPFKMPTDSINDKYGIGTIYKALSESKLRNNLIIGDVVHALSKGRTPIVISERTDHVQYLAESLRKQCKNVIVLTGKLKNREKLEMIERLQAMPSNEPMIIIATGRYIGEGFDFPRLDTLFLAMPISWKGTLAQYAGRLHRTYENKEDVFIYDYVDIHVETLEKMYHKRMKGYASIGYKVWENNYCQNTQAIYESETFMQTFIQDLKGAEQSILIVSPSLSKSKVMGLKKCLGEKCTFGIKVCIVTKPLANYKENSQRIVAKVTNELEQIGCEIVYKEEAYQKFGVIDKRIVWYGNIHILGYEKESETIMRIDSIEIAEELEQILVEQRK